MEPTEFAEPWWAPAPGIVHCGEMRRKSGKLQLAQTTAFWKWKGTTTNRGKSTFFPLFRKITQSKLGERENKLWINFPRLDRHKGRGRRREKAGGKERRKFIRSERRRTNIYRELSFALISALCTCVCIHFLSQSGAESVDFRRVRGYHPLYRIPSPNSSDISAVYGYFFGCWEKGVKGNYDSGKGRNKRKQGNKNGQSLRRFLHFYQCNGKTPERIVCKWHSLTSASLNQNQNQTKSERYFQCHVTADRRSRIEREESRFFRPYGVWIRERIRFQLSTFGTILGRKKDIRVDFFRTRFLIYFFELLSHHHSFDYYFLSYRRYVGMYVNVLQSLFLSCLVDLHYIHSMKIFLLKANWLLEGRRSKHQTERLRDGGWILKIQLPSILSNLLYVEEDPSSSSSSIGPRRKRFGTWIEYLFHLLAQDQHGEKKLRCMKEHFGAFSPIVMRASIHFQGCPSSCSRLLSSPSGRKTKDRSMPILSTKEGEKSTFFED